jgi:quinol monooxygenase YgiN
MLVVNRFRVSLDAADGFRADLEDAQRALASQAGYLDGTAGRNVDDPELWVLVTRWRDVGSYRRALSSYDVKVGAVPVLSRAIDEPSAFEDVDDELNVAIPRGTA